MGHSPWGCKELVTTEWLHSLSFFFYELVCFWVIVFFFKKCFPQVLLKYNWHTALCKFKVYDIMTCIHHEIMITRSLVNIGTSLVVQQLSLWAPNAGDADLISGYSSVGKEYACNAGDPSLIHGLGRYAGEGSLPTLVSWLGEFHGLSRTWGCKDLDTTEWLSLSLGELIPHAASHGLK